MNKRLFSILLLVIGLTACENFDIDHPDFDYTSAFFPYQFPVRTLVLGDYIYDNTNDNNHKFLISAAMGGVYENDRDRELEIEVDNSLCSNIFFSSGGNPVQAMPSNYYTLSSNNKLIIPKGKLNGNIEVQLTDAFFNDPQSITLSYVVPVRLLSSADVDTILAGSGSPLADPRIASEWAVPPKNFTLFAVKYINEYHGTYFHYGSSKVKNASNTVIDTATYSKKYIEQNATSKLVTTGRYEVSLTTSFHSSVMTGEFKMLLNFDDGNNCTITSAAGSAYAISGTGEFQSKKYFWGNKDRDGIILNYTVSNGEYIYEANDVLVIRDRGVVMEVYSPVRN